MSVSIHITELFTHLCNHSKKYLFILLIGFLVAGLWPFNFSEKNEVWISPEGGLNIARHGTAYTALPPVKLQDLKQFAILIDISTSSDGLDSLEKIFGYFISQEAENFFVAQWKDGIELRLRTKKNAGGMIFGEDGVLKKEERATFLIIYDGQKIHLYKNGTLVRKDTRGPLSFGNWDKAYPLVVGTDANGRSQWKGRLFQIAVWDRSLIPEAVADFTKHALEGDRGADSRQPTVDSQKKSQQSAAGSQQPTTIQENPPRSPFMKGGSGKGENEDKRPLTKAVTSHQWPVNSEGEEKSKRPLIHYVFKPENSYETEFRGKKAIGVRDLGKGEAADLVIPEQFTPYERVYLGWDLDWGNISSNRVDVLINIIGFVPFGILMMISFVSRRQTVDSRQQQTTIQENPPESPFMKGGGLEGGPFAKGGGIVLAVILTVVAGFVVSFAIEYLQAYLPSRDSSLRDLVCNTMGTAIGTIAAAWIVSKRSTLVTGDQ